MRISNFLPAVCAAALVWGGFAVQAQDNPAQAAARAALMQKLNELNAQQPPPPANPSLAPIVISPASTNAAPPAPPVKPATASPKPAKAKPAPKPAEAKPAPAAKPVSSADNSGFSPVPPPSNPQVGIAAPAAASGTPPVSNPPEAKNTTPAANPPPEKKATPAVAPVVKPPPPANANYPGKTLGFQPIVAPPPPVSAQKQAELQALLDRYTANQLSPEEYQKQRAAILAEP